MKSGGVCSQPPSPPHTTNSTVVSSFTKMTSCSCCCSDSAKAHVVRYGRHGWYTLPLWHYGNVSLFIPGVSYLKHTSASVLNTTRNVVINNSNGQTTPQTEPMSLTWRWPCRPHVFSVFKWMFSHEKRGALWQGDLSPSSGRHWLTW